MTTTDPDYLALLRGVLHAPADDLPRLVLADWLDEPEHGEHDRAEFIRVQCEFQKHEMCHFIRNEKYKRVNLHSEHHQEQQFCFDLHDLEMKLLWGKNSQYDSANWEIWCWAEHREPDGTPMPLDHWGGMTVTPHGSRGLGGPSNSCTIPVSGGGMGVHQVFTRGFVGSIRLTSEQFEQHAAALFAQHPITEVVLSNKEPWENEYGYSWWSESELRTPEHDDISKAIFSKLTDSMYIDVYYNRYPTREAALAALSLACVRYGRRLAGLRELQLITI